MAFIVSSINFLTFESFAVPLVTTGVILPCHGTNVNREIEEIFLLGSLAEFTTGRPLGAIRVES